MNNTKPTKNATTRPPHEASFNEAQPVGRSAIDPPAGQLRDNAPYRETKHPRYSDIAAGDPPACAPSRLDDHGVAVALRGGKHVVVTKQEHRADRFIDSEVDPREGGTSLGDERATLIEFLRGQRLTLQLKCEGLEAKQLARRSVEPSTMSLLGLVRHLADVERKWFRQRFGGQDVPTRYQSEAEPDGDFDEQFARDTDLDFVGRDGAGEPVSLRELLVHMIEEYARHNGHADLLRERIDGRIGQ
jgi:uncharacterized damage-inducible protein DinB